VWQSLKYIISDAVLKYALSATRSKREAADSWDTRKNINRIG
jgi:hypothetical protein